MVDTDFKKIPEVAKFFGNAYGCEVFPTVGKGGPGIGAARGKGQVHARGTVVGFRSTANNPIGFQAGTASWSSRWPRPV